MKEKHTPGPWSWDEEAGSWAIHDGRRIIARVPKWATLSREEDPHAEANTRLVAASPGLYGACEKALSLLLEHHWDREGADLRKNKVVAELRAALKRARGEE